MLSALLPLSFQLCHGKNKSRLSALHPRLQGNKISGKSSNASRKYKQSKYLRIWPAMGDYLKGGKEKCRMVTFQLVKQKSIGKKRVNIGGRFSIKALQMFSVQNVLKKLFI